VVVGTTTSLDAAGNTVGHLNAGLREFANGGFAAEHDGIGLLKDSVGNIGNLGAGGVRIFNHAFKHVGGHDDGAATLLAELGDPALDDRQLLVGALDAEVATGDHDGIGGFKDGVQMLDGLHRRSPLMAGVLTLSIVSLAGIPPLAGFLGKFLLLKSVIDGAATGLPYVTLITIAIIGVIVSLYYYFGIIREIYWSTGLRPDDTPEDKPPFEVPLAIKASLVACAMALVFIGIYPEPVLALTYEALEVFR